MNKAGSFQLLPQVKGISLNRHIKIADGMATGEVANRPSGEKTGHALGTGSIADQSEGIALRRRQAALQQINVVGHVRALSHRHQLAGRPYVALSRRLIVFANYCSTPNVIIV
jgi:hypothetical protein